MNTLYLDLENNLSKLTIHKNQTNDKNKHLNVNIDDLLLLPINTEKITSLNLSKCNLTELPKCFTFTNLLEVDLSHNQLEYVPHLIYVNKKIQTLNMSNNKLTNFNRKPKCSSFLLDLNLSDNYLTNIPSWIYSTNCDDLSTLKLSNNPFEYKAQLLGRYLKNLKTLELNNTNLRFNENKTRFLMEIPKLEVLHLSNTLQNKHSNFIKDLNFEKSAFTSYLKELHLTGLGIPTIPENIIILENLEVINLNKNYISWFPSTFTRLINLRVLIVSENDLLSLPSDINKLKNLEKLFISDNSVGSIPESIIQLEHLQTLDCYKNDFTTHLIETIKNIPSLSEFDCDQNLFEITSEVYFEKRDKLRRDNGFFDRLNGPKKSDFSDISDFSEADSSSSVSYPEIPRENWADTEPENWDLDSDNSISDDMNLVLPKFRFHVNRPKLSHIVRNEDAFVFEDVSE